MRIQSFRAPFLVSAMVLGCLGLAVECQGGTFGSVVPVQGTVSDIALDESRGAVYAANFSAYRVEVIDIGSRTIKSFFSVNRPPSSVALSLNGRYLVIGEYEKPLDNPTGTFDGTGGLTIIDLVNRSTRHFDLDSPVLTVAFGFDGQALVVMRKSVQRIDPASGFAVVVDVPPLASRDLPVELAKVPTQIIQAASGVSGDKKTILVLAATGPDPTASSNASALLTYDVATNKLISEGFVTTPPEGPRTISVDQTAANFVFGWGLLHRIMGDNYLWAQFPAATGAFHIGTHAWDTARNVIYAQVPADSDTGLSVLHIVDTDNLTVRQRLQLPENLSGKSVMSSDMSTMYSASVSGLTILPVGQLPSTPQVAAVQEDLLFAADACNRLVLTQTLDILALGNTPTDFTLSLPKGVTGVTLSATSGVTPARVQVTIDPAAFQGAKGTTAITLTVGSSAAVNLPPTVRILVNTRDFDQRGTILNVPGKLVDILADPGRSRLYILRQDKNQVQVWDMATLRQIATLRTGNTPTQMAMTANIQYLIVGNDNSQIANVFDLNSLQASDPILFPFGHYPRSIGISSEMFGLVRNAGTPVCDQPPPPAILDQIDFAKRIAFTPCTLGGRVDSIYKNVLPTPDGVMTPSPNRATLLLALGDGNVIEYDSVAGTWVASRADAKGLVGPYAAFDDKTFLAGANLMDSALVITSTFDDATGSTVSGHGTFGAWGIRTVATTANAAGVIQRWDTGSHAIVSSTPMAEAPLTKSFMLYPPIGQIGESVLSFTRSIAVSPDQRTLYAATISGLTIFGPAFDAAPQPPVVTSVTNPADSTKNIATGGAITITGVGLATSTVSAPVYPLPETLGEACVTVNNIALPLFQVSPTQTVAQLPFSVVGSASLTVRSPGGISTAFPISVGATAPAIFHTASTDEESGLPAVYRDDNGGPLTFTNPIHPNTPLTIYMTGLGVTSPVPVLGAATPSDVPYVAQAPTITLGGVNLTVSSATLVPGLATVYQVKTQAPGNVQPGKTVPLTISGGGVSTTLSVRVVTP